MPALLVGLTALVTSAMVHLGYGLWWLSQHLLNAQASYDWTGALTTSGTLTAVVLVAGLLMRRMVAGTAQPAGREEEVRRPLPVRLDRAA